ncbi:MAG: hypothetical protein ABR507_09070 [Actinomycetota bacterium]
MRIYHDSIESWLKYRDDHDETTPIAPDVLRAAKNNMGHPEAVLRVTERVRATVLARQETR